MITHKKKITVSEIAKECRYVGITGQVGESKPYHKQYNQENRQNSDPYACTVDFVCSSAGHCITF